MMATAGSGYGAQPYMQQQMVSDESPSPVSSKPMMGMSFLKGFGGVQKKAVAPPPRDGQQPKRRGPKPDSKPALTRRQELNRQAQRTHRERKEQYIKALENEVQTIREGYSNDITQHRQALQHLQEENAYLRDILLRNGIQFEAELEQRKSSRQKTAGYSDKSSGYPGMYQSHGTVGLTTPPATINSDMSPPTMSMDRPSLSQGGSSNGAPTHGYSSRPSPPYQPQDDFSAAQASPTPALPGVFEADPQLGIDFILALEGPCRDHTEMLCRRSKASPDDEDSALFSGHALMATCPPPTHLAQDPAKVDPYPHQALPLPPANLTTLLNLSRQLVMDGEITPIMALNKLQRHGRYGTLTREDIIGMIKGLEAKVRCYGFGAVLEEFEVRDAIEDVLGTKEGASSGLDLEQMYG